MKPVLGVLGGMGAQAGVDFMDKLVKLTPVSCDQDHIPAILYTASKICSRLDYLEDNSSSDPFPDILSSARVLELTGIKYLVIACNTAHYWEKRLQEQIKPKIISIIETSCEYLVKNNIKEVAIMATTATLKTNLHQNSLLANNIKFITPDDDFQQLLMSAIYDIKSSKLDEGSKKMEEVYYHLVNDKGANKILMSCTEIPLGLAHLENNPHLLDATEILAEKCVELLKV